MAGKNALLTPNKVKVVSNVALNTIQTQIPQGSASAKLTQKAKVATKRSKQLFRLLLASGAQKAKLSSDFFKNLPERLASVMMLHTLPVEYFGFKNQKAFVDYVIGKLISMRITNLKRFIKGNVGRKWWFIGTFLWERYIKYGPVRPYLDNLAAGICESINTEIRNNKAYKMVNAWGNQFSIKSEFGYLHQGKLGKLAAGVEFILETGEPQPKPYLDFGHIAFNKEGYWIIPTPIEIKQLSAAGQVATQFSEFLDRLKSAKKLIVIFEESDLEKLKKQPGFGRVEWKQVDGKIIAELDREKLMFAPRGLKQTVVKPVRETWGSVNLPSKSNVSPDIKLRLGQTSKGGGFNFLIVEVNISRNPFVMLFEAIFLGT